MEDIRHRAQQWRRSVQAGIRKGRHVRMWCEMAGRQQRAGVIAAPPNKAMHATCEDAGV